MQIIINIDDRYVRATKRLLRRRNVIVVCGLLAFGSALIYANAVTVPNQFQPNTVA